MYVRILTMTLGRRECCWVARSNEVYYTLRCKHSTPAGRIRIRIRILMVLIWA